jgi:hypothetical protein
MLRWNNRKAAEVRVEVEVAVNEVSFGKNRATTREEAIHESLGLFQANIQ